MEELYDAQRTLSYLYTQKAEKFIIDYIRENNNNRCFYEMPNSHIFHIDDETQIDFWINGLEIRYDNVFKRYDLYVHGVCAQDKKVFSLSQLPLYKQCGLILNVIPNCVEGEDFLYRWDYAKRNRKKIFTYIRTIIKDILRKYGL